MVTKSAMVASFSRWQIPPSLLPATATTRWLWRQAAALNFLKPGQLGDVLTCVGQEQALSGRHGIYDMKVTNQKGDVIAMFRGKSAQIQGTVIPE